MNWSLAKLRRRLAGNPALSLDRPCDFAGRPTSADVYKLNPGYKEKVSASQDDAQTLYDYIRIHAPDIYPLFIREYPFDRFRIDLAIPSQLLAIEVDGGQWAAGGGRHGSRRDYQKTRRLVASGWRLIRFTAGEVKDDPIGVIAEIREVLA